MALALLAIAATAFGVQRAASHRALSPVLVMHASDAPRTQMTEEDRLAHEDRVVNTVLAGLSDPSVEALADALSELAEGIAIAQNPLVEDLGSDDRTAKLKTWLSERSPTVTAASALVDGRWESADGHFVVQLAGSCSGIVREICVPAHESLEGSSMIAQGQFLAWPVTQGRVLRAPSALAAHEGATLLRTELSQPASRIALVLEEADALRDDRPSEANVRTAARHLLARLGQSTSRLWQVRALARPRPQRRIFPPLELTDRSVLVVPRLSQLAQMAAVDGEWQSRMAALAPRGSWFMSPL